MPLKNQPIKSVNDLLIGHQCFFCINRDWIFDFSLGEKPEPWSVINQVYFRNGRQHKTLSFSLPYVVAELSLASFFPENQFIRLVIVYGQNLNSMMGSINHFMAREANTALHINKVSEPCQISVLETIFNKVLKSNYVFDQLKFYAYEEGFHRTLDGQWHEIPLDHEVTNPPTF